MADDATIPLAHAVDDYEALRTRALRNLTAQADLLRDGLHAIRGGRTAVAEEFMDRVLAAIDAEVARLRVDRLTNS